MVVVGPWQPQERERERAWARLQQPRQALAVAGLEQGQGRRRVWVLEALGRPRMAALLEQRVGARLPALVVVLVVVPALQA